MTWIPVRRNQAARIAPGMDVAPQLADDFLDSYISWREECAAVSSAYSLWQRVELSDQGNAFAAYRAALDREEHAARVFRACTEQVASRAAA